jgi:hypothetical protein
MRNIGYDMRHTAEKPSGKVCPLRYTMNWLVGKSVVVDSCVCNLINIVEGGAYVSFDKIIVAKRTVAI